MVLEPCLAELPCSGYIDFCVACISSLLDAHLIDASKRSDLCSTVRLLHCLPVLLLSVVHRAVPIFRLAQRAILSRCSCAHDGRLLMRRSQTI